MRKKQFTLVNSLTGTIVTCHYDQPYAEYQVDIVGQPKARYHTDDPEDALATARHMCGSPHTTEQAAGLRKAMACLIQVKNK